MRDLISTYGDPIIIRRREPGSFVNGMWVEGSITIIDAVASVQPVSGFELLQLSELQRTRVTKKMYTTEPVYTGTPGRSADIIEYQGGLWEVQSVEPWRKFMTHYKAMLMRIDE